MDQEKRYKLINARTVSNLGLPSQSFEGSFWTDSRTALSWIKADPRNYRQFVSFRVSEILEHTAASDWRWVPSKGNPADEATKWGSGPYFNHESKWFQGPRFLWLPESEWPHPGDLTVLHHCSYTLTIDFDRFSSWNRLQRATAYALRFIHNTAKKQPRYVGQLQQPELHAAEIAIFKLVQQESYPDEIVALSTKGPNEIRQDAIDRHSPIYRLLPMLDNNGMLRKRGRIGTAEEISYYVRYPITM
ncbi:uncharacterized protein LOC134223009 [Armigeres subalbatus]|uniref:uncharacterized protein LOC134223009 n=1 Tax=Armigeres subalbatus TaxID=124917 RepID=UPI002ED116D7